MVVLTNIHPLLMITKLWIFPFYQTIMDGITKRACLPSTVPVAPCGRKNKMACYKKFA